jgi:hypothetical protein
MRARARAGAHTQAHTHACAHAHAHARTQVVRGMRMTGILSSERSDCVRSFDTVDEALEWCAA